MQPRTKHLLVGFALVLGGLLGFLVGSLIFTDTEDRIEYGPVSFMTADGGYTAVVADDASKRESGIGALVQKLQDYIATKDIAAEERAIAAFIAAQQAALAAAAEEREAATSTTPVIVVPECVSDATTTAGVLADCGFPEDATGAEFQPRG